MQDLLDPKFWQEMKWGLSGEDEKTDNVLRQLMPNVDSRSARRDIARQFQAAALKRAKLFQVAMDVGATPPEGFEMFLVAGDSRETAAVGSVEKFTGDFSILSYGLGDDTVTRSSTLLDERVGQEWAPQVVTPLEWASTIFISGKHRTITSSPTFENNALYWLLEDPRD